MQSRFLKTKRNKDQYLYQKTTNTVVGVGCFFDVLLSTYYLFEHSKTPHPEIIIKYSIILKARNDHDYEGN